MFELTESEQHELEELLRGWWDTPQTRCMEQYVQHGKVSTYAHCVRVAKASFWLARRLHLRVDEASLVRGAMLHDYYLYDWHNCSNLTRRHGFSHPAAALANADRTFPLNDTERDIIANHMWPLTLFHRPHCREAVVVCLADKQCSLSETLFYRNRAL